MFEKFSRSWELVKASGDVLAADKQLLVFPLVSGIATMFVSLAFILPALGLGVLDGVKGGQAISAGTYLLGFLFYLAEYFVIFYFNAALIGAVMMRLNGKSPTIGDGIAIANSKLGAIFGYAMIAATVGMILRAIQGRVGFIGSIITGFIGVAWTLASSMVVPILVTKDVGPVEAVKESALMLKKTWGENIIGNAGLGIVFGFFQILTIIVGGVLVFAAIGTKSVAAIIAAVVIVVAALIVLALIQAALTGIYSTALYRYADTGESVLGFDQKLLGSAFAPKG